MSQNRQQVAMIAAVVSLMFAVAGTSMLAMAVFGEKSALINRGIVAFALATVAIVFGSVTAVLVRNDPVRRVWPVAAAGLGGGFLVWAVSAAYGAYLGAIYAFAYVLIKVLEKGHFSKGRRLRIGGQSRVAEAVKGDEWHSAVAVEVSGLNFAERRAIAEVWTRTAELEHASIAAFSMLSDRLLAMGAPPKLVEQSHRAALDEIDHAQRTFAIASAYAGEARTAGPLTILLEERKSGVSRTRDEHLAQLAVGSLIDGCVGEGVAAEMAREAARHAAPGIRETLQNIARDERRHAELGWDVLAWCLSSGAERVERAVRDAAARLHEEPAPSMTLLPGTSSERVVAHGYIANEVLKELHDATIRDAKARVASLLERRGESLMRAAG